jgi:hypothetical protein
MGPTGGFALRADCVIIRYQKRERSKSMKISVLALLLLAGCSANGQYLVLGPFSSTQHATPAELAASDDATCKSYGATFGTPDYIQCREHLSDQRQADPGASAAAPRTAVVDTPTAPVQARTNAPQTTTRPASGTHVVQTFCYRDGSETTCTPEQ